LPSSIVNFQVIDVLQYLEIGTCLLCLYCVVVTIRHWNSNKKLEMINIFWPFMFIVLSLHIMSLPDARYQYLRLLSCALIVITILLWREKYVIALVASVSSLLFISPFFYFFVLIILAMTRYQMKFKFFTYILRLDFLDIATLVTILTMYKFQINSVGIFSIVIFLFMFRNLNNEIVIE